MPEEQPKLQHILLRDSGRSFSFRPVVARDPDRPPSYPRRDPRIHGARLRSELNAVKAQFSQIKQARQSAGLAEVSGSTIAFLVAPNADLPLTALEHRGAGIQLLSYQELGEGLAKATVYVPEGKVGVFERKLREYLDPQKVGKSGMPRNAALVNSINEIRMALMHDLWSDDLPFPEDSAEQWWEIWVRRVVGVESFRSQASALGISVGPAHINFPDRVVVLARASVSQISSSVDLLDSISELRFPRTLFLEFLARDSSLERARVAALANRLGAPPDDAPAVCLLDTGVDYEHPLLSVAHAPEDAQAYNTNWGLRDQSEQGPHGTEMAGFALYGLELEEQLLSDQPATLAHRLENIKIVPPTGANEPKLYGEITQAAAAKAELLRPNRRRVFSMAVTAGKSAKGDASSWSAAVDTLASGSQEPETPRRLILISSGNVQCQADGYTYPDSNHTDPIQDPGQAWNAITVGACTRLTQIFDPDLESWSAIAPSGDMSPSNPTSLTWSREAPNKPDVVFEGGNVACDPEGRVDLAEELLLLTTRRRDGSRFLTRSGQTSGATANLARFCAMVFAEYRDLWPETIRALLVHSADWTQTMTNRFGNQQRRQKNARLRAYGYGIPSLDKALYDLRHRLTLMIQDEIQPFREGTSGGCCKEMRFHPLPWPVDVLSDLGDTPVKMRVTLSYFIEPKPGRRGGKGRYRYPSHGLRFDVRTTTESDEAFLKRINQAARDEGERSPGGADTAEWELGPDLRHRGSIHSDTWSGTAAALAAKGAVAVYPVAGWWKESAEHWYRRARYSLLVSIETPEGAADIYTPVFNIVRAQVPIVT